MATNGELRVLREDFMRKRAALDSDQHQRVVAPQFGESGNGGGTNLYQMIRPEAALDAARRRHRLAARA